MPPPERMSERAASSSSLERRELSATRTPSNGSAPAPFSSPPSAGTATAFVSGTATAVAGSSVPVA